MRRLEIGPGHERLEGFETFNVVRTPFTDHVGDARQLPFGDGAFDEVYSSHCIEHFEWFEIDRVIAEWSRVVKPGGSLEIHTVNASPLMRALLGDVDVQPGRWRSDLHGHDPYKWAAGRILNYRRGGEGGAHWLHRSILTPEYLHRCFAAAGLVDLEEITEPKGAKKHRGINMGLRGRKC